MSNKKLLYLGIPIIGVGLYYAYTKIAKPVVASSQLMPEFKTVQISKLVGSKLEMNAILNFVNPSSQQFTISRIYINIEAAGSAIIGIRYDGSITILPNTSQNLKSIPFSIDLLKIPSYLKSSATQLMAVGYVTANGIQLAINQSFDFDITKAKANVTKAAVDIVSSASQFLNFMSSIPTEKLNEFLKKAKNGLLDNDNYHHATYRIYETKETFNNQYVVLMNKTGDESAYNYGSLFGKFTFVPSWNKVKVDENAKLLVNELIK